MCKYIICIILFAFMQKTCLANVLELSDIIKNARETQFIADKENDSAQTAQNSSKKESDTETKENVNKESIYPEDSSNK